MDIIDFCNTNQGFMNVCLTFGLLSCAIAQYFFSVSIKNTECYKLRIKHIQEFNHHWNLLNKNISYAIDYKAQIKTPEDFEKQRYDLFKFLYEHLEFTKLYFNNNIYAKEKQFVELLNNTLPVDYFAGIEFNMVQADFDKIVKLYKELISYFFKMTK